MCICVCVFNDGFVADVKDAENVSEQLQGASISDKASAPGINVFFLRACLV